SVETFSQVGSQGERLKAPMPCLVVRLSYPKNRPIYVQPDRAVDPRDGGGYEHHFYSEAGSDRGKDTGIFWDGQLLREEVEGKVKGLNLYSVEAFKGDRDTSKKLQLKLGNPSRTSRTPNYLQVLGLSDASRD